MRKTLLVAPLLGMLLLLAVIPGAVGTASAAPHLAVSGIYGEDEYLCVDFRLRNAIDKELLESMHNGVPTLLRYQVDVWLDRTSWYDKLVQSVSFSYKIHYDNWDTLYCVNNLRETAEERIGAGDVAELIHLVCNQQRMQVCPIGLLDSLSDYYITVSAEVRSLSAERVKEIDSWLGGSGDETEEAGGGLLGFVIGVFTSKSKTTETKTDTFNLRGLGG
jgi:hypothetical protein